MFTAHEPVESVVQLVVERVPIVDENEKTTPCTLGTVCTVAFDADVPSAATVDGEDEIVKSHDDVLVTVIGT
jgi:hypothetical protein